MHDMKSDLFASENMAQQATTPGMSLQNAKSVKYAVNGEMHARQGSMIAFAAISSSNGRARESAECSSAPSPARGCR